MQLVFDHLAIAARDLDTGRQWSEQTFGTQFPVGGEHPRMGTHNLLTACSSTAFFEIIAVNTKAQVPPRPRWFGLDDPATQIRIQSAPSLEGWAAGTPDLEATLAAARTAGADLGEPVEMTRGDLTWLISIRPDGALPEFGCLPFLIQWPHNRDGDIAHPASRMEDIGLRLEALQLNHPEPDRIAAVLSAIGGQHLAECHRSDDATAGPSASITRADGTPVRVLRG